ncbi:hypothetical protein K1719_041849 [Acacia pycnantha]|nr:hypothetical protein K1719_041849 [Acacia pycnantha]
MVLPTWTPSFPGEQMQRVSTQCILYWEQMEGECAMAIRNNPFNSEALFVDSHSNNQGPTAPDKFSCRASCCFNISIICQEIASPSRILDSDAIIQDKS